MGIGQIVVSFNVPKDVNFEVTIFIESIIKFILLQYVKTLIVIPPPHHLQQLMQLKEPRFAISNILTFSILIKKIIPINFDFTILSVASLNCLISKKILSFFTEKIMNDNFNSKQDEKWSLSSICSIIKNCHCHMVQYKCHTFSTIYFFTFIFVSVSLTVNILAKSDKISMRSKITSWNCLFACWGY